MTPAASVASRLAGAIGGGYLLSAQWAALGAGALAALGMARSEATTVALLSAYLLYAGVLLWAFWVPSLARLWWVVAAGTAGAWALREALG